MIFRCFLFPSQITLYVLCFCFFNAAFQHLAVYQFKIWMVKFYYDSYKLLSSFQNVNKVKGDEVTLKLKIFYCWYGILKTLNKEGGFLFYDTSQ